MPLAAVDVNFYMYFFPKPVKCKRYPEAHWTDLIGFVCCGYWEKITPVFMLYVLRRVWCNWLWLYLINKFTTNVSALKLCKNWEFCSVDQCGGVFQLRCTEQVRGLSGLHRQEDAQSQTSSSYSYSSWCSLVLSVPLRPHIVKHHSWIDSLLWVGGTQA